MIHNRKTQIQVSITRLPGKSLQCLVLKNIVFGAYLQKELAMVKL